MVRIFLCHASEDTPRVRDVYRRLRDEGFQPWLDEEDLLPGQLWEQEIPKALKAADFMLIFLSQQALDNRSFAQRELKLALDAWEEMPAGALHTILVRLDTCEIPERFRQFQQVDLFDERSFERMVQAIRIALSARQPSEPAPRPNVSATPADTVLPAPRRDAVPPQDVTPTGTEFSSSIPPSKGKQYDIFLSYAREDVARVSRLAQALERHGWSVWWDYAIPTGQTFAGVIAEALESSRCMVVVWSKASVESYWVKDVEAEQGRKRGILLPVMIDEVEIPLAFSPLQTTNLIDWHDTAHHPEFDKLVQAITERLGSPPVPPKPPPSAWKKILIVIGSTLLICAVVLYFIFHQKNHDQGMNGPLAVESPTPFYNRSYAVVIGIDKYPYSQLLPSLGSAVADARAMAEFLKHQGFKVQGLYDQQATKKAILEVPTQLAPLVAQDDRVLVFFAGFAQTEQLGGEIMEYLVPYDGKTESGSYISIADLSALARHLVDPKHLLFILHTQFDGSPYAPRSSTNTSGTYDLEAVMQRVARQVLVSGILPAPATPGAAPRRSDFMTTLLKALRTGQADSNDNCYVIVPELVDYLRHHGFPTLVISDLPLHRGGEFAFHVDRTPDQVEARLSDKTRSLCRLDLRQADLRQRDLSGRDLREADLREADLSQARLNQADLRWAKLAKAYLRDATLQEARLSQANLQEVKLAGADLRAADLNRADLRGANLQQARLQGARLSEANLMTTDLIAADLSDAILDLADLRQALLKDAILHKAQLGRANLRGALLRNTDLSEADFRDADVDDVKFEPKAGALPNLEYMQQAKHLDQMTYDVSPRALLELRDAFEQAGMHDAAQQVTSAVNRHK